MITPKQSAIELEVRCESCGALDWFLLEQLKLSGGQVYCRVCRKIYEVEIGVKTNKNINTTKAAIHDVMDGDLDFVRRMLKNQNFSGGEVENMIAGAFSKGIEFGSREELIKECLSCHQI